MSTKQLRQCQLSNDFGIHVTYSTGPGAQLMMWIDCKLQLCCKSTNIATKVPYGIELLIAKRHEDYSYTITITTTTRKV